MTLESQLATVSSASVVPKNRVRVESSPPLSMRLKLATAEVPPMLVALTSLKTGTFASTVMTSVCGVLLPERLEALMVTL